MQRMFWVLSWSRWLLESIGSRGKVWFGGGGVLDYGLRALSFYGFLRGFGVRGCWVETSCLLLSCLLICLRSFCTGYLLLFSRPTKMAVSLGFAVYLLRATSEISRIICSLFPVLPSPFPKRRQMSQTDGRTDGRGRVFDRLFRSAVRVLPFSVPEETVDASNGRPAGWTDGEGFVTSSSRPL